MHFGSIMTATPPPPRGQMINPPPASPPIEMRTRPPALRDQWFKTKMCPHWPKGTCLRQEACCFAHSESELREPPRLWKTKMCHAWSAGVCRLPAEQCKFAHGEPDLWCTPDYFKTDICKYWRHGKCTAGELCRHAHGHSELRPRNYRLTELERRIERIRRQGSSKGFESFLSSNDSMGSNSSAVTSTPVSLVSSASSSGAAPALPSYSSGMSTARAVSSAFINGVSSTTPTYPIPIEPVVPSYPQEPPTVPYEQTNAMKDNTTAAADTNLCSSSSTTATDFSAPSSSEGLPAAPFFSIPTFSIPTTPQTALNGNQSPTSAAISSFAALSANIPSMSFSTSSSSSCDPSAIGTPPTPLTALVQSELFKAWMPLLPPAAQPGQTAIMAAPSMSADTMTAGNTTFVPGHMTPLGFTPIISGPATPLHGAGTPLGGGHSSPNPSPTFAFLYSTTPVDPAAGAGGTTPVMGPASCPMTPSPVLGPAIFAPAACYPQTFSGTATPAAQHGISTPPSPQLLPHAVTFVAGPATTAPTTAAVSPTACTTTTTSGSPSPPPPLTFSHGGGTTPILGPTTLPPSPVLAPLVASATVQQTAAVCPTAVPPTGLSVTRVGSSGGQGGPLSMATSFKAIGSLPNNIPRMLISSACEQPGPNTGESS